MAVKRRRRRKRSSLGLWKAMGLLLTLCAAAALGIGIGLYITEHSGQGPPRTASASEPTPAEDRARQSSAPEPPQKKERSIPAREPEKSEKAASIPAPAPAPATSGAQQQRSAPSRSLIKPRRSGFASELAHGPSASGKVALTFDAGASPAPTPDILRALRAAGLRVTFFLTGTWCEKNPELTRQIISDGHEIANHTYSHKDLRKLSDQGIIEQLDKMDEILVRLTGRSSKPYFRPPYGSRDKRVLSAAAEAGYTSVYWSIDSWDAYKANITSGEIKDRITERVQGGDIVLMHCGSRATADALPELIRELESRGYRIVPVSELAGD